MAEDKLGAQRARVFEGEIGRLRGRNELLTNKINYQGKALQAMGDALSAFVDGQKALERRIAFLELPAWRRRWFKLCAYCRPVWIRVVARDAPSDDVALVIADEDAAALERILGTSVRPQPGDDILITEAYAACKAEQAQSLDAADGISGEAQRAAFEAEHSAAVEEFDTCRCLAPVSGDVCPGCGGRTAREWARLQAAHDVELARFEGASATDDNVRPFRGKVAIGE